MAGLYSESQKTTIVSEHYTISCMQERNVAMVNAGNCGLALWNGSAGGTANCIKYANSRNKQIINVWKEYSDIFIGA